MTSPDVYEGCLTLQFGSQTMMSLILYKT